MAMSFAVTLFKDGQPFATIRSVNRQLRAPGADGTAALLANGRIAYSEEDNCIFKADVPCDGSPVLGDTGGLVPDASDCPQCTPDLQNYLAAATALASATQIAIDTGTIIFPAVYIGLAAAAIYVAILLSRYNTCVAQCRGLADSGGGDALFTPSSRLLSPYRSMYLRPA